MVSVDPWLWKTGASPFSVPEVGCAAIEQVSPPSITAVNVCDALRRQATSIRWSIASPNHSFMGRSNSDSGYSNLSSGDHRITSGQRSKTPALRHEKGLGHARTRRQYRAGDAFTTFSGDRMIGRAGNITLKTAPLSRGADFDPGNRTAALRHETILARW